MAVLEGCCCDEHHHAANCIICGKPIIYLKNEQLMECAVCHKVKPANAACVDGHFVCDECHASGSDEILGFLRKSREDDPVKLYLDVCKLNAVHLHGPEHHSIVPCVLLTAYKNCGGELDYGKAMDTAWRRGQDVPGGACGFMGICGAAAGAGIFESILVGASPLTPLEWELPQRMTMEALKRLVETGGPRCCKRTGRLAIETAVDFLRVKHGFKMPVSRPQCTFSGKNKECIKERCPFFNPEN